MKLLQSIRRPGFTILAQVTDPVRDEPFGSHVDGRSIQNFIAEHEIAPHELTSAIRIACMSHCAGLANWHFFCGPSQHTIFAPTYLAKVVAWLYLLANPVYPCLTHIKDCGFANTIYYSMMSTIGDIDLNYFALLWSCHKTPYKDWSEEQRAEYYSIRDFIFKGTVESPSVPKTFTCDVSSGSLDDHIQQLKAYQDEYETRGVKYRRLEKFNNDVKEVDWTNKSDPFTNVSWPMEYCNF